MKHIRFLHQYDSMQCGITCLQMICEYYGKRYSLSFLEKLEIDNIDEIVEKLEKFYEANYIEPVESNLRKKVVEKFKKIIKFTKNIFIDYSDVFLNYTSLNLNKKIERAPPYNFDLCLEQK